MNSRPIAAAFFVAFCLLLCGLILHRQIAAHPMPQDSDQQVSEDQQRDGPPGPGGDSREWRLAGPAATEQIFGIVHGQIAALQAGDGPKALSYESRRGHQLFPNPKQFMERIKADYPQLEQAREPEYGPIYMDKTGQEAGVLVRINGNGSFFGCVFLLTREQGQFKVERIRVWHRR